jgi:LysR family glycine cleavage system transcriptional activator
MKQGGIRRAAAALNISQPAVSQSLRQLELQVGALLLDRSTRPPGLTDAGRLLHRATVEGLGRIATAIAEIEQLAARAEHSVTIACSVGFATYWLMPRLATFYDRHPMIAISVRTTSHGAPRLAAGIDLAIRYGDGRWNDGIVQPLFAERVDPVCSPALAPRLKISDRWFDAAALIHVDVEDQSWLSWSAYLRAKGHAEGRRPGLHFTNYVQATQAALGGQGIMLGWRSITGDLVKEGRLALAVDAPFTPKEAFYLVTDFRPRSATACATIASWLTRSADGSREVEASSVSPDV